MCQNKILSSNAIGYIAICESSNTYHVEIGNLLIRINEKGFQGLKNAFYNSAQKLSQTEKQRVFIETPMTGFFMTYTSYEMAQCIDLLEEAAGSELIHEASRILKDVH